MAIQRERPYGDYNFLVDLGSGDPTAIIAGFSEVLLPQVSFDVIEYRTGNEKESGVRKIPGRAHYSNLILKRGVIGALDLYQWVNQIQNGDVNALRNVVIQLQSEDRASVVMTWKLFRSWPVRYSFSSLEASGKEALIEVLELACERLEME
jgi:phage tail-like protein